MKTLFRFFVLFMSFFAACAGANTLHFYNNTTEILYYTSHTTGLSVKIPPTTAVDFNLSELAPDEGYEVYLISGCNLFDTPHLPSTETEQNYGVRIPLDCTPMAYRIEVTDGSTQKTGFGQTLRIDDKLIYEGICRSDKYVHPLISCPTTKGGDISIAASRVH